MGASHSVCIGTIGHFDQVQDKLDKVVFISNFFEELRRIAPVSKK